MIFFILTATHVIHAGEKRRKVYDLNKKAITLLQKGEFKEAIGAAERAVKEAEKNLGRDHPGLAASLTNLGEIYVQVGKYAEAEPLMRRAVKIAETSWGVGPADLGAMLNNLGKLYAVQGRYEEAESMYMEALGLKDRIGRANKAVATWLNNLAVLYIRQQRYADAWSLGEKSLTLLPSRDSTDPAVAETFSLMGALALREGKPAEAKQLIEWSLSIRKRAFGNHHPVTASSIHNLGMALRMSGDHKKAERLLLQALEIRKKTLPEDHPDLGESLLNIGIHFFAMGDPNQAQNYFKRSFENLAAGFEQYFTYMSEQDRLDFLNTVEDRFPVYYSFCLSHRQNYPEFQKTMLNLLLWQKGMVAVSVRALRSQIASESNPEAVSRFQELRQRRTLLANLLRSGAGGAAIKNLEKETKELERKLARSSAFFAERRRSAKVRWEDVRDALEEDDAAVEYVAFPFHDGTKWTDRLIYAAFVIRPKNNYPSLILLGEAKRLTGAPMHDYRKRAGLERDPTLPDKPGFYESFWKPMENHLMQVKRIFVSPAGILNQVSWAVIPTTNQKRLTEKFDLRVVSSTRELLDSRDAKKSSTAVLMGNPDFESTNSTRQFNSLPGTKEEVVSVYRLLKEAYWTAILFEGSDASEGRLKSVNRPRLLHIATHGFFDPVQTGEVAGIVDPMLRSGLVLAGEKKSANLNGHDGEDGILTALEASTLNLHSTELVVLSACDTGRGSMRLGEGVFGLRRAFQEAGAEAVLMSMWKAPDAETRDLMTVFYRRWIGGSNKHRALQEAQQELRLEIKEKWGRDRPELWGAFVLVGR